MLRNYFLLAWRNLRAQKLYSFLNIAGLAVGLACFLVILLFVQYETSFDQFHQKKDQLYRVAIRLTEGDQDKKFDANHGFQLGPTLAEEVPGIEQYTRVHPNYGEAVLTYQAGNEARTFAENQVLFVDSSFLQMFDFPLLQGDRTQMLHQPHTMVLTDEMARKYFGDEEPLGKLIEFTGWVTGTYTVVGVLDAVPATSSLRFDFLLPMQDLLTRRQYQLKDAPWGWTNFITYVQLTPSVSTKAVEAGIVKTYRAHRADEFTTGDMKAESYVQPLTDIHLNKEITASATVTGDRQIVTFFSIIGYITLLIALVNYINLTTARAAKRAKEVGIRKAVGAQKAQLIGQFLTESALVNVISLLLAAVLVSQVIPLVNHVADVTLDGNLLRDGKFWVSVVVMFVGSTLLAGGYPAFILASFKPLSILKQQTSRFSARVSLRKVLVVVQFTASIALLAGALVVYAQLRYMQELETGLDLTQVLVIEGPKVRQSGADRAAEMATLKQELTKLAAVEEVSISGTTPGRGFEWQTEMYRANADPSTSTDVCGTGIDSHFAPLYGLEVIAGAPLYEGMVVPDSGDQSVLINETLARALGFANNEAALGERITPGGDGFVIRGVVKDFRWSSAHQPNQPVLFFYQSSRGQISLKVSTHHLPGTLAAIEAIYQKQFPGNPFSYDFADAAFDAQYKADRRFATLFGAFTAIALFIASLGLFGLATFAAAQRMKEISIRKVLGASTQHVTLLLSKDFLLLVLIAFVIATPLAWYGMHQWLHDFAYQIELGPGHFALAGCLALLVALLTIGYQSLKAAVANPVDSLRNE